jgi:two-component system, NtrC family, sensor histidine kinase KinB
VTDGQGRITRLNRAAESLFGARAEAIGKPISDVAHDQRIAMAVSEALRAERTVAAESVSAAIPISINGTEQSFRLRTTPMRDQEGHLPGAVALLVEAYGGQISARSEVGRGTTITFTLPVAHEGAGHGETARAD